MELQDAIKKVNANFKHKKDSGGDKWQIMGSDMQGDCEDYALTISYLHSGDRKTFFSRWMKGYYKMWRVSTPKGKHHVVLEVEGKFIDNFYRTLVTEMKLYEFKSTYSRPALLGKFLWSLVLGLKDALRRKR